MTDALRAIPAQPTGTTWPTGAWPVGELPLKTDRDELGRLVDNAFGPAAELGETHALVAIAGGGLVLERYAPGFSCETPCPSWSMAKSITHALVGILAGDGLIDIHAPARVAEWQARDDPRRAITLDQLLRMSSGLAFLEAYIADEPSDVIEMLWGKGKDDVGAFAASFPLAHRPGTFWSYSSGTTNIVARLAADVVGARGPAFETFMRERLFEPIGMKSPEPKFDAAGTFIGSSFCFATARDFARFGLLYLRGGVWNGVRILPEGWVDYARTSTFQQTTEQGRYGAHWWLGIAGPGSFSANGYEGQFVVVDPGRDLVIVRLGKTSAEISDRVKSWLRQVAECFPLAQ
ncbi:MAG TPA: serine hydrolase [Rhizomicrobium sp.]|jgi:CubicO group peptidase (beta-lactamase class C family)